MCALPYFKKELFLLRNFFLKRHGQRYVGRTYFGKELETDPRDFVQRMILNFGFWEPNISSYVSRSLSPGDTFADVGANVGYYSLLASTLVGQSGQVVSFEASPRTYQLLLDNLRRSRCDNVRALNVAVADSEGTIAFYEGPAHALGVASTLQPQRGGERVQVEASTLLKLLSPEERASLRLLKIDIEGGEPPVIRQLLAQIDQYSPELEIIVEVNPALEHDPWPELLEMARQAGFTAHVFENEYDDSWYLGWSQVREPVRLEAYAGHQQDLVLSRRPDVRRAARGPALVRQQVPVESLGSSRS
jgi:FkbM family methyltransferase